MRGTKKQVALLLVGLMILGGPWAMCVPNTLFLESSESSQNSGTAPADVQVDIVPGGPSTSPYTLMLPNNDAAITNLNLSLSSKAITTSQSFIWDDASAWNHPDASHYNTFADGGDLVAEGSVPGYDFNTGAQGWTFSNSNSGRVTTPSCGLNASSGGSIRTYQGSTYATSPVMNLSSLSNVPLHAWVRQGSSSCGEEPDSNEDLQIQYRTSTGSWTTLHTFSASAYASSPTYLHQPTQFNQLLPAAALHSNSQIRFHQTGGSGSSFDWWFFDDVKIVTPPITKWTSPTFGSSQSASFSLGDGQYQPMFMNVNYPDDDANVTWTLVDATTGLNISGFEEISSERIHLDALDYRIYPEMRLVIEFEGSSTSSFPSVSAIIAGGQYHEYFTDQSEDRAWTLENATVPLDYNSVGRGYVSQSNVSTSTTGTGNGMTLNITASPLTVGIVETTSVQSPGHGYIASNSVQPSGGSGTGLSFSMTTSPILTGRVGGQTLTNSGTNYTSTIASTSGSATGTGLRVSLSSTPITAGMVQSLSLTYSGMNYSSGLDVSTFTIGSGTGLTLDISTFSGSILSATVNSSGSNYAVGDRVFVSGGSFNASFNVDAVSATGGEITSLSINSAGQNYAVGDVLSISGGDGDARLSVTSVYQSGGNITSVSIINGGSNYLANDVVDVPGGDNNGKILVSTITKLGGNVTSFEIASSGQGYRGGDQIIISGGDGDALLEVREGMNGTDSIFVSPWYKSNGPLTGMKLTAQQAGYDAAIRTSENLSWTSVTLPFETFDVGHTEMVQVKFEHTGAQDEVLLNAQVQLHTGSMVQSPSLDVDGDGDMEWGGSDVRVGHWGYQNKFSDGNYSLRSSTDINGIAKTSVWLPQNDLASLAFSLSASNGSLTGMALRIGGSTLTPVVFDDVTATRVELNAMQIADLMTSLSNQQGVLYHNSIAYVEVEIEAYGTGEITFSNLAAPYHATNTLVGGPNSHLVKSLNAMSRSAGPSPTVTLPFVGETIGYLEIITNEFTISEDVVLKSVAVNTQSPTLTPSQNFVNISAAFDVAEGRTVNLIRLDVVGSLHQASWLIPPSGLDAIGQGRSDLVELNSNPISHNQNQQGADVYTVSFRMEQGWDDEEVLSVSLRSVLDNGVISRPGTYVWGSSGIQGYENDLEISSITYKDSRGTLNEDIQYLMADEQLDLHVSIGYEGVQGSDAFADGDAEVQLWRQETMLLNTTSLDVEWWNISDQTPFTFGDLTWTVKVVPLNGGQSGLNDEISRTFTIDPTAPSVIASTVDWYDHRIASTSQTVQFQILDPVLLPSDVRVMLWRQWIDDVDLNGWPSADEYKERSLVTPTDLTSSTGLYTLLLDDSMGSLGQKVAGYLVGVDASGQVLEDAGTAEDGEHLFMYQIGPDGPPSLSATAMSWTSGANPWLHPSQPYTLRVDMSEPNGASDLTTVEIQLASNTLTSPLSYTWDFRTDSCTSNSIHLIVHNCQMLALDGTSAGPYEKDTRLVTELELAWTTPDLGDTFREPSVKIIDRAGQEVLQTFPALRWRFSPSLMIPQDSVSLVLTQGTVLDDGARIPPNSPFELTGSLMFETTEIIPDFNCSVDVMFAGQTFSAETFNGVWNVELQSPPTSGTIPLTWSVGCLPPQGIDATEKESSVKWMVVDGLGPEPQEVQTPRPGSILTAEEHEVTIVLSEEGGIDFESLRLAWWVENTVTGEFIREGYSPFLLQGTEISGLSLTGTGTMDLSVITDEMLIDRFTVFVLVEGRDLAGNLVLGADGQSAGNAITSWLMEWRQPKFELDTPAIEYSRLNLQTGDSTAVQIFVKNVGTLDGTTDATISVVRADGTSEVLRQTEIEVAEGGLETILVDWAPEQPGLQWVEVILENGATANGPSVDVRPKTDPSFSEAVFGNVNPILGSIGALLGLSIIVALLIMARNATVRRGSRSEYEWDEYSDYLDEDEYEDSDDEDEFSEESTTVAATESNPSSVESNSADGWTRGSDGVWWWQNQQDGSWWYKDANGEIVQYK